MTVKKKKTTKNPTVKGCKCEELLEEQREKIEYIYNVIKGLEELDRH